MPIPLLIGIGGAIASAAGTIAGAAVVAKVAHSKGYNSGHSDGSQSGYNRASKVYEEKLKKQADTFLSEKNALHNQREDYEALLDDYECEIQRLEDELNEIYSSEGEDVLRKMKNQSRSLKQVAA